MPATTWTCCSPPRCAKTGGQHQPPFIGGSENHQRPWGKAQKFLPFSFNRVMQDGAVRHLLVTMQDITPHGAGKSSSDAARSRARKEFSSLVGTQRPTRACCAQFPGCAESQLLQVNDLLRSVSEVTGNAEPARSSTGCSASIHSFIRSVCPEPELLAGLATSLRTSCKPPQRARNQWRVAAQLLLLPLENLLEKITVFRQIATASAPAPAAAVEPHARCGASPTSMAHLASTPAQSVAKDLGKQIRIRVILDKLCQPAATAAAA